MLARRTGLALARCVLALAFGLLGCDASGCGSERVVQLSAARAAVVRCEAALGAIERDAPSLAAALAQMWRECADVQRAPACRKAWSAAGQAPLEHPVPKLAQACGRAYCAALPEPRPRLCGGPLPSDAAALDAGWAELQRAIWIHELGAEAGGLQAALVRAFYEAGERWPARERGGEAR